MPISASTSIAAWMLAGTTLLTCSAAAAQVLPRADAMHARREAADVDVDADSYTHPLSRHAQPDLGSQLSSVDVMPGDDVATPGHPGRSLLHPRTKSCHRRRCGPLSLTRHACTHVASHDASASSMHTLIHLITFKPVYRAHQQLKPRHTRDLRPSFRT